MNNIAPKKHPIFQIKKHFSQQNLKSPRVSDWSGILLGGTTKRYKRKARPCFLEQGHAQILGIVYFELFSFVYWSNRKVKPPYAMPPIRGDP